MRTLEVFLNDKHIGQIAETRKGARFSYDDAIAEQLAGLTGSSSNILANMPIS